MKDSINTINYPNSNQQKRPPNNKKMQHTKTTGFIMHLKTPK